MPPPARRTTAAPRLGLASVPTRPPEDLRLLVTACEDAGLDEFWVWEDCFKQSGISSAAAALAWTDRITVAIGLLPAPLRAVSLTAMEIATTERMFPGRLVAGVGHGVQSWMGQAGVRVDSPLTLLREYTDALRGLLAGEEVSASGRYVRLDRVRLDWPPLTPPPLFLGGAGPRSLALAGELGDGVMLATALTPEEVADSFVTAGLAEGVPGVSTLIAATGPGAPERLAAEIPRWGAKPVHGRGVAGGVDDVVAAVDRLVAAGATTVVFQPTEDEPDIEAFIDFVGSEVAPRVRG